MDRQKLIAEIARSLEGIKTGPPEQQFSHVWWLTVCALQLYGTKWREIVGPKNQEQTAREELISLLSPILYDLGKTSGTDCALIVRGLYETNGGIVPELFDPNPLSETKPRRGKYLKRRKRWSIEQAARMEVERGAAQSLDEARLKLAAEYGEEINIETHKRMIARDRLRVTKK